MLEIQDEIRAVQGTLPELRRRRDVGRQALDDLTGELDRLSSELEEKTLLLKQVNRQRLVTEREIKENRNRIFFIRDRLSAIDEGVYRIQVEFERREEDLARLLAEKEKTSQGIFKTEREIIESSGSVPALERENEGFSRRLEALREEKQAVSDAISRALSETSLEREGVEARMQELNTLFLAQIQERNTVGERIGECEEATKALHQDIAKLEDEKKRLERIKLLKAERDARRPVVEKLREEGAQLRSKLTGLQEALDGGRKELDSLIERLAAMEKENRSLEKEVAEYDEVLKKLGEAQGERDLASEAVARDLEQIRTLFTNRRELQTALLLMDEWIKALEDRARSTD